MSIQAYLKDRILFILVFIVLMIFITFFLSALAVPFQAILFVGILLTAWLLVMLGFEYTKKRRYYRSVLQTLEQLDKKYLLSELVEPGDFAEGDILYTILRDTGKSMNDKIAAYRAMENDYREFIETWVHEIKTPIASARLATENNPGTAMKKVGADLTRIESLVTNVLYYARSSNVEKDYVVKEITLKKLVTDAVKKNARQMVENHIAVEMGALDEIVYTDEKWIDFILGQVITNAVKYKKGDGGKISFSAERYGEGVNLYIQDEGIGIPQKDVPRVFQKGFTGENGRLYSKSTGMGLYLCKKLCDKLGIGITARSDGGATIIITFPKSSMHQLSEPYESVRKA